MNPYELEQLITRLEGGDNDDPFYELGEIQGGNIDVQIEDAIRDKNLKITTHASGPKFTRPILSIYDKQFYTIKVQSVILFFTLKPNKLFPIQSEFCLHYQFITT